MEVSSVSGSALHYADGSFCAFDGLVHESMIARYRCGIFLEFPLFFNIEPHLYTVVGGLCSLSSIEDRPMRACGRCRLQMVVAGAGIFGIHRDREFCPLP